MASRFATLALLGIALALSAPVGGASAATTLGSVEADGPPTAYACESCPAGAPVGFRQFALQGSVVEAPEPGVLVSARVVARRLAGTEPPRIAVLRPSGGVGATIVGSAPVPVSAPGAALHDVGALHLAVEPGDVLGFLFRAREVSLGAVARPKPDGAVVSFTEPCGPCGADAGTGFQLLFEGSVEPDDDGDGLGDESQDPDLGGLLDGFDDGDLLGSDEFLDEDSDEFGPDADGRARRPRRLRLLEVRNAADGSVTLRLAVPRAGRLRAVATVAARARRRVVAAGRATATRAGRVRLRVRPTGAGRRLIDRRDGVRARLVVEFVPRAGGRVLLRRPIPLEAPPTRRDASRGRS